MSILQNIQQLIDQNSFDRALELLDSSLPSAVSTADEEPMLVIRGKLYWRTQNYRQAICDFERALALNPASEAGPALELARDIFDFYNPSLLNP